MIYHPIHCDICDKPIKAGTGNLMASLCDGCWNDSEKFATLKAENERLRKGVEKAIDEDAKPDEWDFEWLSRVRLMLISLIEKDSND